MEATVIPLGVGSAMPTAGRHFSCTALKRPRSLLLFDCGEGAQYRLRDARLKVPRIETIFVTHLHGDHFFGLPGLLSTLSLLRHASKITVVSPIGLKEIVRSMPGLSKQACPYPIEFVGLSDDFTSGCVYEGSDFRVMAACLDHTVSAVGYRYEEKTRPGHFDPGAAEALGITRHEHVRKLISGKTVVLAGGRQVTPAQVMGPERRGATFAYVTDTMPCPGSAWLALNADVLYHEATFLEAHADKARATGHATAEAVGRLAAEAGAHTLLLGHFSARYDDDAVLVAEAARHHPRVRAARELEAYPLGAVEVDGQAV